MKPVWSIGDDTIPKYWKMKKFNEKTFIMSPEGKQYQNRVLALIDMIKNKNKCSQAILEEMYQKIQYEGWKTSDLLPKYWYFKVLSSKNNVKGLYERRWSILTKEGLRLNNFKVALSFMKKIT